ncbi:MAG TPA: metallophosphoesterase [Candidatus Binatia bacterium]|nr:metallophosphoesterase [Candidatus Binatia bacterium]
MATFALISDPHVCGSNPDTGWTAPPIPNEPTMYDRSIELLEAAIAEINALADVDFVLVPGDLTRDSEPYNHERVRELLTHFRKPVFCVSGNHDQPRPPKLRPPEYLDPQVKPVRTTEIPRWYGDFGFSDTKRTAYSCDPTPDVHLVGLCSPKPDEDRGWISPEILAWLDDDLSKQRDPRRETVVMLHHSIIDHVPAESVNPTFSWFHVENSPELKTLLRQHGVRLTFTGHLHIQDVKEENGLYNIATASLAGYPHAYRIMRLHDSRLDISSRRLRAIPSQPDLQGYSRRFTADAFVNILADVLQAPPFKLPAESAAVTAEKLRNWWPSIADGDEQFAYTGEELGNEALAAYVNSFSDRPPADNDLTIELPRR